jgi:hypothetical protein
MVKYIAALAPVKRDLEKAMADDDTQRRRAEAIV